MKNYYFIDLENVGIQGLVGIELPAEDSEIRIFLSATAHIGTEEVRKDILASKAYIDTFYCATREKNAMDFQISAYVGAVLNRNDASRISIISNDNGYGALEDYARKVRKDVVIYRAKNILEAFVAAEISYTKRGYITKKKCGVDFKHIMDELAKVRSDKEMICQLAGNKYNTEDIERAVYLYKETKEAKARYVTMIKTFGRAAGTEIYRNIKGHLESQ